MANKPTEMFNAPQAAPRVEQPKVVETPKVEQPKAEKESDVRAELQAQIDALQTKLSAAESKLVTAGVSEEIELEVRARMRMGLSRDLALVCARRQQLHDNALDDALKITDENPDVQRGKREAFLSRALIAAASAE